MNPTHIPVPERMPAPAGQRKAMRPNALRNAQVMPPHNVDLTLSPSTYDDIHLPAHMTGTDLSKEGPADADAKTKADIRRRQAQSRSEH
jgi:hypothetical protein